MPLPVVPFSGVGGTPTVLSATAPNLGTVIVYFSTAMDPAFGLTTTTNYTIPGTAVVAVVAAPGDGSVTLYTSGLLGNSTYTVTVAMTLQDLAGNPLGVPNFATFVTPATSTVSPFPAAVQPPSFPSGDSQMECGLFPYTQADLLAVYDQLFPENYLQPLKNGQADGYELFQAMADVGARISLAAEHVICATYYLAAPDAASATGTVLFSRSVGGPALTILSGTLLEASNYNNQLFRCTQDTSFLLNEVGPLSCPVQAAFPGYQANLPGEITAPDGSIIPGAIDKFVVPFQDPALADPSITIRQPDPTTGGTADTLDLLGSERGIPRQPGEPANRYRARIRALPDTVSLPAIVGALTNLFQSLDPAFVPQVIETYEVSYQTCYDCPSQAVSDWPDFDPNLFAYDDPREQPPVNDRYLDENDHLGGILAVLPLTPSILEWGGGYDDTATVWPGDYVSTVGTRSLLAYDLTVATDMTIMSSTYDGYDAELALLYVGAVDLLNRIKAGGVSSVVLVLQPTGA